MIEERMTVYDLQLQITEKITYHLLAKVEIVNKIVYCWRKKSFLYFPLKREINWKLFAPAITIHYSLLPLYFPHNRGFSVDQETLYLPREIK